MLVFFLPWHKKFIRQPKSTHKQPMLSYFYLYIVELEYPQVFNLLVSIVFEKNFDFFWSPVDLILFSSLFLSTPFYSTSIHFLQRISNNLLSIRYPNGVPTHSAVIRILAANVTLVNSTVMLQNVLFKFPQWINFHTKWFFQTYHTPSSVA